MKYGNINKKNWYSGQEGVYAFNEMDEVVQNELSRIFGYYALEMGEHTSNRPFLRHSRIKNNFTIASEKQKALGQIDLIAEPEFLPIMFDNIDLIIASHLFESSKLPHQVLREIDRILVPEGHCFLIGFNPYSLLGLSNYFSFNKKSDNKPTFYSMGKMKDWLQVLGFEIISTQTFGYRPSIKNKKLFRLFSWLEVIGNKLGGKFGYVYLIHARKTTLAQTPVMPWAANKILPRKAVITAASRR